MIPWRKLAILVLVSEAIIVSSVAVAWALVSSNESSHVPIFIEGNAGFNRSNGVTNGDGTTQSPFVIERWDIDAFERTGITIENTTAQFVIRGVHVHSSRGISFGGGSASYNSNLGIQMVNVSGGTIEDSTIIDNWVGLSMSHCRDVVVTGNNISESGPITLREGIMMWDCTNITLSRNTFFLTGVELIGNELKQFNSHTISHDNMVNGKPLVYIKNQVGSTLDGGAIGQLIAANCTDLTVSNLQIQNAEIGIHLAFVRNTSVHYCNVNESHDCGIFVQSSSNTTVGNCDIWGSESDGVVATNCSGLWILGNTMRQGHGFSLRLNHTIDSMLSGNSCQQDHEGAILQTSNDNLIANNHFSKIEGQAILLAYSSNNVVDSNDAVASGIGLLISSSSYSNIVRNNTFAMNKKGVTLGAIGNVIYGNNFVRNGLEALDSRNGSNRWNSTYPRGGNFWWNLTQKDNLSGPMQNLTGADGIRDLPAVIAANVTDSYPLAEPGQGFRTEPIANITFHPDIAIPGYGIYVNASGSWSFRDPVSKLQARWDWGDDGTWDTNWSVSLTASFSPRTEASAWVRVAIMDANGSIGYALGMAPLDAFPPLITLRVVSTHERSGITLYWTVNDNGSGVSKSPHVLIDGKDLSEAGLSYDMMSDGYINGWEGWLTIHNLVGIHTVKVVASDIAGNSASVQMRIASPSSASSGTLAIITIVVSVTAGALILVIFSRKERKRKFLAADKSSPQPKRPSQ